MNKRRVAITGVGIVSPIGNTKEEFWQSMKIPYQIVEMCTGDLSAQAAKTFDMEAWMPGRDGWGEVTSVSNTTDYQARRLNLKYRKGSKSEFVHILFHILRPCSLY